MIWIWYCFETVKKEHKCTRIDEFFIELLFGSTQGPVKTAAKTPIWPVRSIIGIFSILNGVDPLALTTKKRSNIFFKTHFRSDKKSMKMVKTLLNVKWLISTSFNSWHHSDYDVTHSWRHNSWSKSGHLRSKMAKNDGLFFEKIVKIVPIVNGT